MSAWSDGRGSSSTEDAKRRFAEAVDLYFKQKYAEALTVFETLAAQFPGNEDIERGRGLCVNALRRSPALALEHQPATPTPSPPPPPPPPPPRPQPVYEHAPRPAPATQPRRPDSKRQPPETLDLETLQRILLDKMVNGATEDIQLRAAELAARVFGYIDDDVERDSEDLQKLLESGDGVAYVALLTVLRKRSGPEKAPDQRRPRGTV
jgi:hypothetical protein